MLLNTQDSREKTGGTDHSLGTLETQKRKHIRNVDCAHERLQKNRMIYIFPYLHCVEEYQNREITTVIHSHIAA